MNIQWLTDLCLCVCTCVPTLLWLFCSSTAINSCLLSKNCLVSSAGPWLDGAAVLLSSCLIVRAVIRQCSEHFSEKEQRERDQVLWQNLLRPWCFNRTVSGLVFCFVLFYWLNVLSACKLAEVIWVFLSGSGSHISCSFPQT